LPEGETVECPDFPSLLRALERVARPEKGRSCGWGPYTLDGPRRSNDAVEELYLDLIDVDHKTPEQFAELLKVLGSVRYAWHYTHSNDPDGKTVSARVLVPLAKPVLKTDWKTYRGGTHWAGWHDPATKDPARFYYCPPLGQPITYHEGELFDPYLVIDPSNKGYEAKIARIGDGLGRSGFQATIVPAIAAYVSAGRDVSTDALERLKSDIRERIDAAPKRHDRAETEIARYKADDFLDTAILNALNKYGHGPGRTRPLRCAPYTEAELAALAQADGVDAETYMRRLVLVNAHVRFVRLGDTYQTASTHDSMVTMRQNLERYPVKWNDPLTGRPRGREFLESEYATKIAGVVYDSRIDRTIVEPRDEELRLRVACGRTRANLKAVFSSAVDSWIDSTSNPTAIRAFMADVYNLDRALFALILWGPPGTGKTSFAEGVARAWSDASTKGSAIFPGNGKDPWTAPLLDCPLVFSDETAPNCSTRRLREFLGSETHRLTRKFDHDSVFVGFPRLIIAGHDERCGMKLNDAAPDEIAGTAARFQAVHVPADARIDYNHFVRDMGLAQHALWLRDNHPVARDTTGQRYRFGLPPDDAFAKMLSVAGDAPTRVLQWLASALANPSAVASVQRLYYPTAGEYGPLMGAVAPGALLLWPNAIARDWNNLPDAPQKPRLDEIKAVLRTVCRPLRVQGREALALLPETLRDWCREYGADEPAALRWVI